MITKYGMLILTVLSSILSAQLRLELKLIGSVAEVTIINTSKDYYVLPIDKVHLRPYERNCNTFSDYESEFPAFGLMVNLIDSSSKQADYVMGYKSFTEINSVKKNIDRKREKLKRRIIKWGDENKIKDYNTAFINYSLIQNLVYIKPDEKFTFKIKTDLHNITNQELIFYSYNIKNIENYNFYVSLCEYNDLDKYLTSSQKKKLSKYKFFNSKLESNKIQLRK
jgi:hypothetical protein